ncbi:MAG: acyl-CoA thioesterase [Candidatus Neomarinimicrobiota bacterium]|nr:MAG: acyl-CoA thioesterase [bacterium]|tara:strand:- start:2289 stop:2717 length:429 start_codon:yes stop_codon:yes gene_type:complete
MKYQNLMQNDFEFVKKVNTRWRDMDAIGHINHATYLTYFETTRVDFLNELGFDSLKRGVDTGVILASMKIDYLEQSSHPREFNIGCRITRLGNKSFDLCSAIFDLKLSNPVVVGVFTLVTFDYKSQKSIVLTDNIKSNFLPF